MAQFEGINLPSDLYYHPEDHLWVRLDGTQAWIGIDDMAQQSAGAVTAIRLKPAGRLIVRGRPLGTMEAGKYVGPLKAPLSGRVIEINQDVIRQPGLLNQDPYRQGWLILMEPTNMADELVGLVHGDAIQSWLERSVVDWRQRGLLKK